MALKLGKCRLCLKLGDFYSIFTVDNAVQLAEMVMDCARIKVYEGDGLPDKVCAECIQKLSSAYIFKQQCERADQELRRNYVPPPGFSISPPPPNRQSSDSAFSTHTDSSNLKTSFIESKVTPVKRSRKRSVESDNASEASRSQDYGRPSSSKRVEELRRTQKRPRLSANNSNNSQCDSDYEDNGGSSYIPETDNDSDEPLIKPNENKCDFCSKTFRWRKSMKAHMKNVHGKKDSFDAIVAGNSVTDASTPKNSAVGTPNKTIDTSFADEEKLSCSRCDKTFKLKIMLKRHLESCTGKPPVKSPVKSPQKELFISLEPIDAVHKITVKKPTCEYCTAKFKTVDNLEKHLRVVHAAVLKKEIDAKVAKGSPKPGLKFKEGSNVFTIPCVYCEKQFDDYYVHQSHFTTCPKKDMRSVFECPICKKVSSRKNGYFIHIKSIHFEPRVCKPEDPSETSFECRICSKKLLSQEMLVTHLAAHASNIDNDNDDAHDDGDSRPSTFEDSASVHSAHSTPAPGGALKCRTCDKEFKYRKSLVTHEAKHTEDEVRVKNEPPDKTSMSLLSETHRDSDFESSQDDEADDLTCDICEKMFSYKRLLEHHKRTKHNMSSGTKRAKINLKDCSVRCLLCDLEMKVSAINEHNQKHISKNIKPRNIYTCAECSQKFKSCSNLANHIKLVHRLKQTKDQVPRQFIGADLADFCEVVVTKAEPLDHIQSHNGFGEVPSQAAPTVDLSGFSCPTCGKKMPTLISLKRHINWHSYVGANLEKKLECFVCKETFKFQCHFKIHMREHYHDPNIDPALLTCSICGRKSKHLRAAQAHMNWHKQTRFQNKDYQCSICKRVFQFRKVYLSHMAIHYKKGESAMNTVVGDIHWGDNASLEGSSTCHLCGKVCLSDTSLKHHLIWHKSKTLLYGARHECQMCRLQFTNKRHLELHIRAHYEDENGPFKCNVCGKGYSDEDYMRRHMKGHNFDHSSHKKRLEKLRKDKVKCPICSRYYPDLVRLIRHLRRTHPESKMIKEDPDAPPPSYFSCKLCAKVFLDAARLKKHEEMHLRKPNFFRCKFCGRKTISLKAHNVHIKAHLTRKHVDNPLKCPQCEEKFVLGYALHHHLRDTHGVNETWIADRADAPLAGPLKELQCSVCLKVLASKGNFERHLDYHNSLRCNYCFDYFGGLRFLEGHLAFSCDKKKLVGDTEVHTRRIKCELCYKAFHLQVKLDCHLRTRHGVAVERRARAASADTVCDYCFRTFENEFALAGHRVYHRSVGYFGCIYCARKFNTRAAYNRHKTHHLYSHNADEPTKCDHCDETFVAFRDMIDHMKDEHGDDKEWIVEPKESTEEKCPICEKMFYNLPRHLQYHEENKCKKCNEYFYSRLECDNHLCAIESDAEEETLGGDAPARAYEECTFCFKPITKKDSKKKHDILHKTSGAISCRFCYLKFKTIDAFNIHAFSHRSRKYVKRPIKCRVCKERFTKYGPFMKHMKAAHKSAKKLHYRAVVKPEPCVVCGEFLPNLHNHYRAHLVNRCQLCAKYFTSSRLYARHECDKEDADPTKVFTSEVDLPALITSYIPKDEKDDEKFYGYTDDEEDPVPEPEELPALPKPKVVKTYSKPAKRPQINELPRPQPIDCQLAEDERNLHMMVQSPIISDVLSLYQKKEIDSDSKSQTSQFGDVVHLSDDSLDATDLNPPVIVIDDSS